MIPILLKISFVFAITGHSFDLASTVDCRARLKCTEANHWLGRFADPIAFTAAKMPIAGVSEVWIYDLSKDHPKWAIVINTAVGTGFTALAVHNRKVSR
jgi:hypothetical protein